MSTFYGVCNREVDAYVVLPPTPPHPPYFVPTAKPLTRILQQIMGTVRVCEGGVWVPRDLPAPPILPVWLPPLLPGELGVDKVTGVYGGRCGNSVSQSATSFNISPSASK